ncbi:MAG: NapC/NirT family cytochrome c [Nitrospinae bacterium]|nr:NapC/NirT family cytochrome c [Nitrospinota bacterium]
MKLALLLLAMCNAGFIAILWKEWGLLGGGARKLLAFISLGVFPLVWGAGVLGQGLEEAQKVAFCAQCHVMTDYVKSLEVDDDEPLSAFHYQNNLVPKEKACFACHTQYTMFGPIRAKLQGLSHLYVYYIKGAPAGKISLYSPYDNRECLRCHESSRKYQKLRMHNKPEEMFKKLADNKQSCLAKGCHDLAHLIEEEESDDSAG